MLFRSTLVTGLGAALLSVSGLAWAQTPLDDAELSAVYGQALLSLTNTSQDGYDFSRLTIGADIQFNANLTNVRLGEYTYSARNGTGADIDLGALRFGRSDGTEAQRLVHVSDPYLEFVYKNTGNAGTREVVGMRLGFGSIQGDVGIQMNSVSGSLLINTPQGTVDSRTDPLGGKRWDGTTCGTATCGPSLSQLNGLTAGDASGASRDFFLSVLRESVQFPAVNGIASDKAITGFWLNWRDRLAGTVGSSPAPNLPKPPGS
jgi:hypothetical protein